MLSSPNLLESQSIPSILGTLENGHPSKELEIGIKKTRLMASSAVERAIEIANLHLEPSEYRDALVDLCLAILNREK
jgi:hypothetical protein